MRFTRVVFWIECIKSRLTFFRFAFSFGFKNECVLTPLNELDKIAKTNLSQ